MISPAGDLRDFMSQVPDPRGRQGRRHALSAILTAVVCGELCGASCEQHGKGAECGGGMSCIASGFGGSPA